jgi:hypothetical protein
MQIPQFFAHGALGPWDEVIFISVIVIFITMMGISWFQGRGLEDEPLPEPTKDEQPQTEDRFRLE